MHEWAQLCIALPLTQPELVLTHYLALTEHLNTPYKLRVLLVKAEGKDGGVHRAYLDAVDVDVALGLPD